MIFYVTKDIERAIGIDLEKYPDIIFISNYSLLAELLHKNYPDRVILSNNGDSESSYGFRKIQNRELSTFELLKYFKKNISKTNRQPNILIFKNSIQIERFCLEQGWKLLNAPSQLVEKFERKINQYEWLNQLPVTSYQLPVTLVDELSNLNYGQIVRDLNSPFILQYNIGHTGENTFLIPNQNEFEKIQKKFPKRKVKISKYIKGEVYTVNACVFSSLSSRALAEGSPTHEGSSSETSSEISRQARDDNHAVGNVLVGEVSLQLTGLPGFTNNPLATVGNDWSLPTLNKERPDEVLLSEQIKQITLEIGKAMAKEGWRGLFGIDIILEKDTGKLFLIEINARQPASASFETQLAHLQNASGPLDWQLTSLTGQSYQLPLPPDAMRQASYQLNASQLFLRKSTGPIFKKFKNITKIGEYDQNLNLIAEKSKFDLSADSDNIFLQPHNSQGEFLRIQINKPYKKIF